MQGVFRLQPFESIQEMGFYVHAGVVLPAGGAGGSSFPLTGRPIAIRLCCGTAPVFIPDGVLGVVAIFAILLQLVNGCRD